MMHGRLLGGLAARALERELGGDGWRAARLTVDLFRPAAMEAVEIDVTPIRDGRKVRVADATLTVAGHTVGRVTGLFLATGAEPPGRIWRPEHPPWPSPDEVPPADDGTGDKESEIWQFRTVTGGMGSAAQTRVWTNDTGQLVEGEDMTPLVRAAASGDIACPLANASDQGIHYINADYTLLLGRYPVGPWIGLETTEQVDAGGIAIALATMWDEQGIFAMSSGASISRPPLEE